MDSPQPEYGRPHGDGEIHGERIREQRNPKEMR